MLQSLQQLDIESEYVNYTASDIIASLTLNDVKTFLEKLGVSEIEINEEKEYLICPTICHHPLSEAHTMKLYWYHNYKIFHCYTECNDTMSIFKLYQKFIKINENKDISFYEAEDFIKKCIKNLIITPKEYHSPALFDLSRYKYGGKVPQLNEYSKEVLTSFTKYYHPTWLRAGITKKVMDKFGICFSIGQNKIVIPHYDIDGRLIGIRARALEEEDIKTGKYKPILIGSTLYNHSLQFNLYGIHEHKKGINRRHSAIIAEGEKSVLLDDVYYEDLSNTVACCGFSINKYQIALLTEKLGVSEITIAFDKEYNTWKDEKAKAYREKIEKMCQPYKNKAIFSYIFDRDNLLHEKDSPFDRGKEIFDELYKNRIKLK